MNADSSSRRALRIGAVSYLNSKPLIYGLDRIAPKAELLLDVPSRLADALAAGALDVALIPSIEYLRNPEYQFVSDACIACRGPVLSVKLLSRKPIAQIRSVALDEGSRTSVALVRLLLRRCCNLTPQTVLLPLSAAAEDMQADAVLLIGDRAIPSASGRFVEVWDLGQRWWEWAQLPFVFALWAARPGLDCASIATILATARDQGVAHLRDIAEAEAGAVGLSTSTCYSYLHDNLYFYFGKREREGLDLFRRESLDFDPMDDTCQVDTLEQANR